MDLISHVVGGDCCINCKHDDNRFSSGYFNDAMGLLYSIQVGDQDSLVCLNSLLLINMGTESMISPLGLEVCSLGGSRQPLSNDNDGIGLILSDILDILWEIAFNVVLWWLVSCKLVSSRMLDFSPDGESKLCSYGEVFLSVRVTAMMHDPAVASSYIIHNCVALKVRNETLITLRSSSMKVEELE